MWPWGRFGVAWERRVAFPALDGIKELGGRPRAAGHLKERTHDTALEGSS